MNKRIIASIVAIAFLFTQCGIGFAAPVYKEEMLRQKDAAETEKVASAIGNALGVPEAVALARADGSGAAANADGEVGRRVDEVAEYRAALAAQPDAREESALLGVVEKAKPYIDAVSVPAALKQPQAVAVANGDFDEVGSMTRTREQQEEEDGYAPKKSATPLSVENYTVEQVDGGLKVTDTSTGVSKVVTLQDLQKNKEQRAIVVVDEDEAQRKALVDILQQMQVFAEVASVSNASDAQAKVESLKASYTVFVLNNLAFNGITPSFAMEGLECLAVINLGGTSELNDKAIEFEVSARLAIFV